MALPGPGLRKRLATARSLSCPLLPGCRNAQPSCWGLMTMRESGHTEESSSRDRAAPGSRGAQRAPSGQDAASEARSRSLPVVGGLPGATEKVQTAEARGPGAPLLEERSAGGSPGETPVQGGKPGPPPRIGTCPGGAQREGGPFRAGRQEGVPDELQRGRPPFQQNLEGPRAPPGGAVVKDAPAGAGDSGLAGSIPGPGRPPGGGHASPRQCSPWRIPWTEAPGGLESTGHKRRTRLSVSTPYLGPNTCWVESANASHSQPLQLAEDPERDGLRAEVKLKAQAQGEG